MGKSFLQRFHARMYAGSWRNPFFADPRKIEKHEQTRSLLGIVCIVLSACCTLASLAFWYGTRTAFALDALTAEGPRSFSEKRLMLFAHQELRSCSRMGIPCSYTWNVPQEKLRARFLEAFPLEAVTLTLQERTLHIWASEKVVVVPVRMNNALWIADKQGILLREGTQEEFTNGVLIPLDQYYEIDVSAEHPEQEAGVRALAEDVLRSIEAYQQALHNEGISVRTFALTNDPGKIIASTDTYDVYFSPWEDPERQVLRLSAVLAQSTPSAYADIRFGEKIYIK